MPYKLVSEHEDNATFKEIAESFNINFSRGEGLYELIKKEKVSAKKQMVLYYNGKLHNDNVSDVRRICGLPAGDVDVLPKNIPAGYKLFIQSSSPNRKIPAGAAVLIVVDNLDDADNNSEEEADGVSEDEDGRPSKKAKGSKFAINFDELLSSDMNDDMEFASYVKGAKGSVHNGCDERVPYSAQKESLFQLSQLYSVYWDKDSCKFQTKNGRYTKVSASGI